MCVGAARSHRPAGVDSQSGCTRDRQRLAEVSPVEGGRRRPDGACSGIARCSRLQDPPLPPRDHVTVTTMPRLCTAWLLGHLSEVTKCPSAPKVWMRFALFLCVGVPRIHPRLRREVAAVHRAVEALADEVPAAVPTPVLLQARGATALWRLHGPPGVCVCVLTCLFALGVCERGSEKERKREGESGGESVRSIVCRLFDRGCCRWWMCRLPSTSSCTRRLGRRWRCGTACCTSFRTCTTT